MKLMPLKSLIVNISSEKLCEIVMRIMAVVLESGVFLNRILL